MAGTDTATAVDARDVEDATPIGALLLPVGPDWHALEMTWVREVVAAPLITPLPTTPGTIIGVFNLRGEIVPLIDTAALLGLGTERECSFAVVVDTEAGPAGLGATGMPESVDLGAPIGSSETEGTAGSYAIGTRLATLLDPGVLLAPDRLGGSM